MDAVQIISDSYLFHPEHNSKFQKPNNEKAYYINPLFPFSQQVVGVLYLPLFPQIVYDKWFQTSRQYLQEAEGLGFRSREQILKIAEFLHFPFVKKTPPGNQA